MKREVLPPRRPLSPIALAVWAFCATIAAGAAIAQIYEHPSRLDNSVYMYSQRSMYAVP